MEHTTTSLQEIKLIGIQVRTSRQQEQDKITGKIFPCVQRYFHQALFEKILNRKNPGTTFCAYTDYETDCNGAYSYFIGEEVTSFETDLPEGLATLIIPQQTYAKFTTKPAPMPDVVGNAWEEVWKMSPEGLGGKRRYCTDFEVYDERAVDQKNAVLDLYIGIEV